MAFERRARWSTALITGATRGIGAATAERLSELVDVLVVHGVEREEEVAGTLDALRRAAPSTDIVYLSADYGRLSSVADLITEVEARAPGLDLLINNAGRPGAPRRQLSADGHEITLQANYLALVALTTGLLPVLQRATAARVINVASATHYSAELALDDLELERDYSAVTAYARSKLAIVTYTCWLARQLEGSSVEAVSLHPGVISTGLLHAMFGAGGAPVDRGARNIVALAERSTGVNGAYFDEDEPARPNSEALDPGNQDRLVEATSRALAAAGVPSPG
jgi:NAD(P)-dependent dehydrogenase (short-subunit alcohol dehydrogenase family)